MDSTTRTVPAGEAAVGRDLAWVAYALHGIGYLSAMMWPAFLGLVINYVKRGDRRDAYPGSHHDWMIRTFWYGLLWYLASVAVLVASAWPFVHAVLFSDRAGGTLTLDWGVIFSSIGLAILGGIGFLVTWIWLLYRVIRGAVRLSASRPAP